MHPTYISPSTAYKKALFVIPLLIFSLSINIGNSQSNEKKGKSLSEYFSNYDSGSLTLSKTKKLKTNRTGSWQIDFSPLKGKDIVLYESDIISPNYKLSLASKEEGADIKIATAFSGYISSDPTSQVRVTISDDGSTYGYIKGGNRIYYIEPTSNFISTAVSEDHVIYQATDVLKSSTHICAAEALKKGKEKPVRNTKVGECHITELAIAVDFSYWTLHEGTQGAIDQSIAVMNMVAGSYENGFADAVRFEIVEHFVSDCADCDPWIQSDNANQLLDDFTAWGPTGFSASHDIGQFWTNRNLCDDNNSCSIAGLAWIGAVCGTYRYHILENFTTTAWQLRVLVAHEMGHNFGANHDASGSGHIMAPSVSSNTESWSSTSINSINTAIAGFTCFESCIIGACTEIVSLKTTNCTQGTVSTYDLTLEIRHGGGGTSSSFDVIVDGQSYTQNWLTSPQTVVITGLAADGEENNTVSIEADDGGDSGCSGGGAYDAPAADCAISIKADFNDCDLPQGWTKATTNVYSWNGGDPLVQYEWKFDDATRQFANYDDQGNASSPLTIDGSCMALMDDDIINHNLYTGDVTLTSAVYDISDVDELQLKFDYNFHKFDEGGKGANSSSFKVEVYDGSSWVNIVTDDDDTCAWNDVWQAACTDYVDMDVSAYINSSFKVRFIYSDGNDSKWTGMIALDNVEINGTVSPGRPSSEDCEDEVVVEATEGGISEAYWARYLVKTSGSLIIDTETMFAADRVEINNPVEITQGTEFTILSDGCD